MVKIINKLLSCLCLALIIMAITTIVLASLNLEPITYSRTYPKGYSDYENDASNENIITVRPKINNSPASFSLGFHIQNKTLIIDQHNIAETELYWDRAIDEEDNGNSGYYASFLVNEVHIQVKGDEGRKKLTIHNMPRQPKKIVRHDGEPLYYNIEGDSFTIIANPIGNYTVYFTIDEGVFDSFDEDDIASAMSSLTSCCVISIILILIFFVVFFRGKGGGK